MDPGPIDEVAAELGISRKTVYRLIKRHGLQTFHQVGDRRTWIDRDDLRPLTGLRPVEPRNTARGRSDGR